VGIGRSKLASLCHIGLTPPPPRPSQGMYWYHQAMTVHKHKKGQSRKTRKERSTFFVDKSLGCWRLSPF